MEPKANERKSLSTYQLASYGAPSVPLSMVALPLAVYLTPVYADSAGFGLSLAFVNDARALRVFDESQTRLLALCPTVFARDGGAETPFILIGMPIFMLGFGCCGFLP